MKTFKVTVTVELALPDDYEVATDPTDSFLSLRKAQEYFMPTLTWMERMSPGEAESPSSVDWQGVDDDTANMFINESVSEGYDIEQINPPQPPARR